MSRQQRKSYGTQDYRKFPYIDLAPLPEVGVSAYVRHALDNEDGFGSRLTNPWPSKPFLCRKTGKTYMFWDNYQLHVRKLSPLIGPSTRDILDRYTSPYDERTFHFRDNCKLHNRVKRLEEAQELEVMKRLNLDSGPSFTERDLELAVKKKRLDFRFLPQSEKTLEQELAELRRKRRSQLIADAAASANQIEEDAAAAATANHSEEDEPSVQPSVIDVNSSDVIVGRPLFKLPENYDDLPPLPRPPTRPPRPAYRGWTHSDQAESWFLEKSTPYAHDDYNSFTKNLYGKKAICPKLWPTVFMTQR